jgi:predicted Zn-dependent protease
MPTPLRPLALAACLLVLAAPARADEPIEASLARLDAAIAASPREPELWMRRADLERRRARFDAANSALARAAELGAGEAIVARERGLTAWAAGRPAAAERALREARDFAPDDVAILVAHARALAAIGQRAAAAEAYAKAVGIEPRVAPDVHLERVRANDSVDAALAAAEAGIAALGPVPALEQAALDLESRAGRIDAALARVDAMAARTPSAALALQRAELLERARRLDAAGDAYAAAAALVASQPPSRRAAPASREAALRAEQGVARIAALRQADAR